MSVEWHQAAMCGPRPQGALSEPRVAGGRRDAESVLPEREAGEAVDAARKEGVYIWLRIIDCPHPGLSRCTRVKTPWEGHSSPYSLS